MTARGRKCGQQAYVLRRGPPALWQPLPNPGVVCGGIAVAVALIFGWTLPHLEAAEKVGVFPQMSAVEPQPKRRKLKWSES